MLNLLNLTETGLQANTAVELRKAGAELGIKGASKGKKADLILAIMDLVYAAQEAEAAKNAPAVVEATEVALTDEAEAKKARRSRRGMVIVAKGTEVHKSQVFAEAAQAAGWSVTITRDAQLVEDEETGETYEEERYVAIAQQKGAMVQASWNGRAWDYPNAFAGVGGKARKVRNLKEALRILAGKA